MNINSLMYFLLNQSETSKTELPVKPSTTETKAVKGSTSWQVS